MSFLDDLKKEADAKKQQDMESTQTRMRIEEMRMEMVESRLREVFQYFNDLSKQLNDLKLPITRTYLLEGMGDLNLLQGDYKAGMKNLTIEHKDRLKEVQFSFKCVENKTYTIEKDNPTAIDRQKDYLWRNGIKFEYAEFKNERGYVYRGVFTVPAIVPVTFQFIGDFEKANITIVTKNFNMLVATEYLYNPEEINTAFLEEFAKYILDKPSNFLKFGKRLG